MSTAHPTGADASEVGPLVKNRGPSVGGGGVPQKRHVSPIMAQRMAMFGDQKLADNIGIKKASQRASSPRRAVSPRLRERVNSFDHTDVAADAPIVRGVNDHQLRKGATLGQQPKVPSLGASHPGAQVLLADGPKLALSLPKLHITPPKAAAPMASSSGAQQQLDHQRAWLQQQLAEMSDRGGNLDDDSDMSSVNNEVNPLDRGATRSGGSSDGAHCTSPCTPPTSPRAAARAPPSAPRAPGSGDLLLSRAVRRHLNLGQRDGDGDVGMGDEELGLSESDLDTLSTDSPSWALRSEHGDDASSDAAKGVSQRPPPSASAQLHSAATMSMHSARQHPSHLLR